MWKGGRGPVSGFLGGNTFWNNEIDIKQSFQITVQRLQTEVEELNTELASAKALIGQLQANIDGGTTAKTYAAVASTAAVTKSSNGPKRRPTSGGRRQPTPGSKANRKNEGEPVVQGEHVVSERVKVDGARRVWGTTMRTTTKSISNAISRLCKIEGPTIKRKTSNPSAKKKSWWFVIHADEVLLH